jgi:nucleotide-binding universal stress UspA family protein
MYTHLLIATDGSELSERSARHGIALAKALNAKVTAITVSEPWESIAIGELKSVVLVDEYQKQTAQAAKTLLERLSRAASEAGLGCRTEHVSDAHPYQAIIRLANSAGCDLIVMGSHGRRGIAGLLIGSETVKTLTHSTIPLLVYRE